MRATGEEGAAMSARLADYEGAPEVEGVIVFDEDWYLLEIPAEFHQSLLGSLEAEGVPFKAAARPHVSVAKNEAPSRNREDWGVRFVGERVAVRCCPTLRNENGLHFWVDCHSPGLCELREHFGLPTLRRQDGVYLVNFHLTVGRRKKALPPQPRPQYRLSPQSHIDVETGMQHL